MTSTFQRKRISQRGKPIISILHMLLYVAHGPGANVLSTTRILRLLGASVWVLVLSGTYSEHAKDQIVFR